MERTIHLLGALFHRELVQGLDKALGIEVEPRANSPEQSPGCEDKGAVSHDIPRSATAVAWPLAGLRRLSRPLPVIDRVFTARGMKPSVMSM